ncbi:allophanate hydrolase subunit 1 [Vibrio vulnificus]|nr:allophanate hydrolase subunit 1 [Vibrio vulnificus]
MSHHRFTITPVAECALMIHFDEHFIEADIGKYAGAIGLHLQSSVMNVVPAYHTILVEYLPFRLNETAIVRQLHVLLSEQVKMESETKPSRHLIPVYYSAETALDLARFKECGIELEQLIDLHSKPDYEVSAVGFTPGFAFLSGVDSRLSLPRLASPRVNVPKGSVAIAETKTAIYPSDSPGGWNIIGRTPSEVYQPNQQPITPFSIGDRVTFKPITKDEFLHLGGTL